MFWISTGSLLIVFLSLRAYFNNTRRWRARKFPKNFSKLYFYILQGGNILFIVAGVLFFMLSVVCYVKGFKIQLSSDLIYQIKILPES
jgi:hypothetical protein